MAGIGPAPKPASKRRRYNKPATYGDADPVTAPAAESGPRTLGIDAPVHKLVVDMWAAVQDSAESRFYSQADWERLRMELWHANQVMGGQLTANAWTAIQHGLTELLISPAAKRRAAIELKAVAPDRDEIAAVSMMSRYQAKIKPE